MALKAFYNLALKSLIHKWQGCCHSSMCQTLIAINIAWSTVVTWYSSLIHSGICDKGQNRWVPNAEEFSLVGRCWDSHKFQQMQWVLSKHWVGLTSSEANGHQGTTIFFTSLFSLPTSTYSSGSSLNVISSWKLLPWPPWMRQFPCHVLLCLHPLGLAMHSFSVSWATGLPTPGGYRSLALYPCALNTVNVE